MRRLLCFAVAVMLLTGTALAEDGCTFPDPSELIGQSATLIRADYAFSDDYVCDAYQWPYPGGWDADRLGMVITGVAEAVGGWTARVEVIDGFDGYVLTGPGGETAMLVPSFGGTVLLLVPPGCELVPVSHATPEPTPVPTPSPVPTATPERRADDVVEPIVTIHIGHWETVTEKVDCPNCTGGTCPICHGSGWYRNYGEKVACSIYCSTCKGLGYTMEQRLVWVD